MIRYGHYCSIRKEGKSDSDSDNVDHLCNTTCVAPNRKKVKGEQKMGLINTTGYFKGTITDGGLGQSTGGFPQEVLALKAAEVYDPEGQEYLPVDDEHDEITAYLILISSKDKETRSAQQLKKITGWDGASFVDLHGMDLTDVPLSWRVEERTYEGNTTLQVQWVDVPDATPGKTVQKITKEDAAALQARYAPVLAATKAPTKAVSAKGKGKGKGKPPKAPKATAVGKCTNQEAYDACYSLKRDDVTDKRLDELWVKMVAQVSEDEATITPEQWFEIKEKLLKVTAKV